MTQQSNKEAQVLGGKVSARVRKEKNFKSIMDALEYLKQSGEVKGDENVLSLRIVKRIAYRTGFVHGTIRKYLKGLSGETPKKQPAPTTPYREPINSFNSDMIKCLMSERDYLRTCLDKILELTKDRVK